MLFLVEFFNSNPKLIYLITVISILSFLSSIIIIPIILIKMPNDYFIISHSDYVHNRVKHPVLRFLVHLIKNIMGIVFIIFGFVMLFIPGQGILTTLLGLSLLDFPYKRNLEKRIVSKPLVLKAINSIRSKAKKEPLLLE